jgi:hypothetical protein
VRLAYSMPVADLDDAHVVGARKGNSRRRRADGKAPALLPRDLGSGPVLMRLGPRRLDAGG